MKKMPVFSEVNTCILGGDLYLIKETPVFEGICIQ
jgi:hypothetical protein